MLRTDQLARGHKLRLCPCCEYLSTFADITHCPRCGLDLGRALDETYVAEYREALRRAPGRVQGTQDRPGGIEFKPSKWRYFIYRLLGEVMWTLVFLVGALAVKAVIPGFLPNTSPAELVYEFLGFVLVEILGTWAYAATVKDGMKVVVHEDRVSGASGLGWLGSWRRVSFPLHTIDWARTNQQSRYQRLVGQRCVYSTEGQRILLDRSFEQQQIADILDRIGCR